MVDKITNKFSEKERFALLRQMRRTSISVPSYIVKALGRGSTGDTIRLLYIARGSLYELETQLYLSLDQNFMIERPNYQRILSQILHCKKLLNGFINYLKRKTAP